MADFFLRLPSAKTLAARALCINIDTLSMLCSRVKFAFSDHFISGDVIK